LRPTSVNFSPLLGHQKALKGTRPKSIHGAFSLAGGAAAGCGTKLFALLRASSICAAFIFKIAESRTDLPVMDEGSNGDPCAASSLHL